MKEGQIINFQPKKRQNTQQLLFDYDLMYNAALIEKTIKIYQN